MDVLRTTHVEGVTAPCTLQFLNSTSQPLKLLWVTYDGEEQEYGLLKPTHSTAQGTFTTHLWCLRWPDGQLVGSYVGPSAVVEVLGPGNVHTRPLNPEFQPDPSWGRWEQRAEACGIRIMAYDCVRRDAIGYACHIVRCMLSGCPDGIKRRLCAHGACVGIIGRCQVTTDMPGHTHLKLCKGDRDTDSTTRGLGGNKECPITTCGEENLCMEDDSRYPCENILVHEFAHSVMNIGMSDAQQAAVRNLYESALKQGIYSHGRKGEKNCYTMENADEYWAEGTQAWFGATVRSDVNGGINSRAKLIQHDPGLAALMQQIYGDNPWCYAHDAVTPSGFQGDDGTMHANPYLEPMHVPSFHDAPVPAPQPVPAYQHPVQAPAYQRPVQVPPYQPAVPVIPAQYVNSVPAHTAMHTPQHHSWRSRCAACLPLMACCGAQRKHRLGKVKEDGHQELIDSPLGHMNGNTAIRVSAYAGQPVPGAPSSGLSAART